MNFTNKKKIKVAIIGAGRISEHHLKAIRKIELLSWWQFVI